MLISGFDSVLSDLDGVVYAGPNAIEGAVAGLNALAEVQVSLAFITNNAGRSPMAVAAHLRQLGVNTNAEHVFGSADAGAEMLARELNPGSKVLVVGSPYLRECVAVRGLEVVESHRDHPVAVVQGFYPEVSWNDLAEASYAIAAGARWVATNTDLTIPRAEGIAPGNGSLVNSVRAATGVEPRIAGKPQSYLFRRAAERLDSSKPLVVGDRLDTDILGANRAGYSSALVLTGVDTARTALGAPADQRPSYIIQSLDDFYRPYPTTEVLGYGVRIGDAVASVNDEGIRISGNETDLNGWRAACHAWWLAHPRQSEHRIPPFEFTARGLDDLQRTLRS
ncbi:HAD-IIA family hydrolase [Glutamicibacter sp. MNS18]|uniref:HAD-IIA family hydrolase n=1 Tax=Glutamicibacter sp. MNS18 TaxID=2989817 RepID=UPI0022364D0C|nr:HAD-IIA family hydrolase [Glutamicibacter sp. MNS18]MCW4466945.1 HAD-IIA family hydrolase [Glutamicibacter sp. MNS18]